MPSKAISKSLGQRVVGVEPALRGQVEGDVEAGLAVGDQVLEAGIRVRRIAEARVLAHRPRLLAEHQRVDAPRERKLARQAEHREPAARREVVLRVERLDRNAGFVHDRRNVRWQSIVHGRFL